MITNPPTLSTGQPSTLAVWRENLTRLPGVHKMALAFLDRKIAQQGADQPVIADETQVLNLLLGLDDPRFPGVAAPPHKVTSDDRYRGKQ